MTSTLPIPTGDIFPDTAAAVCPVKVSAVKRPATKKRSSLAVSKTIAKETTKNDTKNSQRNAMTALGLWCKSFSRGYEFEATDEVGSDEIGVMCVKNESGLIACPLTVVQYLIENDEIHSVNEESDVKMFCESEYGPISSFPDQLDKFAALFAEGAKLARAAGVQDVKDGGDEDDSNDEDEDEDKDEDEDEDE